MTQTLNEKKQIASQWFRQLRDEICAAYEKIEADYQEDGAAGQFTITPWDRPQGGGGEMGMMKGRVFEKVGVNISIVDGEFDEKFRHEIPGAKDDPRFWASGISLVAHMVSPLAPAAHFNTRMIVVGDGARLWFGGGGDLNPMFPVEQDTADFHRTFQDACAPVDPAFYPAFKDWCEEYFYIPHRQMTRGVGGIFYDYLGLNRLGTQAQSGDSDIDLARFGKGGVGKEKTLAGMQVAANAAINWEEGLAFTQSVGRAFRDIHPELIRRHMQEKWTPEQREWQLIKRGWYAEYNLLYDRGTRFGLMTGGNPEAILMSLPPEARWP
jgi:coproporphyrinogen III oxidase